LDRQQGHGGPDYRKGRLVAEEPVPLAVSEKKKVGLVSNMKNEHRELTVAGWGCRMNERGWVIYRHPQTRRWHTRPEATAIVATGVISRVHNTPNISEPSL
jgi:hypothetical protein